MWIVLVSEVFTAFIWWRIFRSDDSVGFKVALACVTAIPVLGPLMYPFLDMPPRLPPQLRVPDLPPGSFIGGHRALRTRMLETWSESARRDALSQADDTDGARGSRRLRHVAWFVAVFFLCFVWVYLIAALARGYVAGYATWYGQSMGTLLLLPVCIVATIALIKRRPRDRR